MRALRLMAAICGWLLGSASAAGAEGRFLVAPVAEQRPAHAPEVFVVVTDEQRFSFVAPRGWRVFHSDEDRLVTLQRGENVLTIKFGDAPSKTDDSAEDWLKELQQSYSGAEVLDRPSMSAFSQRAVSFDLSWKHAGQFPRVGRFARVSLKTGDIDFGLACPPDEFGTHLAALMQLMVKMRAAGANERVEIPEFREE